MEVLLDPNSTLIILVHIILVHIILFGMFQHCSSGAVGGASDSETEGRWFESWRAPIFSVFIMVDASIDFTHIGGFEPPSSGALGILSIGGSNPEIAQ